MLLRDLKGQALLPKEEYIINRRANIRGLDVLLLTFTIDARANSLWMIYRQEGQPFSCERAWQEFATNRERLLAGIAENRLQSGLHVTQMEVGGQLIRFDEATSHPLGGASVAASMQLQHFAEKGLLPKQWDQVEAERLVITQMRQADGDAAPRREQLAELPLTLHIARSSREVPIESRFSVQFGKQSAEQKHSYYDPERGRESCFFVDEVYSYDPYQQVFQRLNQIANGKARKQARRHFLRAMVHLCPQGQRLAVIRYETEDDVQLRFFTQQYLEAEPVHSNTGIAFASSKPEEPIGINGYPLRECVLQPMDPDFNGVLQLELFSRVEEIPAETVVFGPNAI